MNRSAIRLMPLAFGWEGAFHNFEVAGGPFDQRPRNGTYNICLRAERIPPDAHAILPIEDFRTPANRDAVVSALKLAFSALLAGKPVYVGCQGGLGRTGLFLALLAKVAGETDPVRYVKQNYHAHAVETMDQMEYVRTFDVEPIRQWLFWQTWTKRIFWWM